MSPAMAPPDASETTGGRAAPQAKGTPRRRRAQAAKAGKADHSLSPTPLPQHANGVKSRPHHHHSLPTSPNQASKMRVLVVVAGLLRDHQVEWKSVQEQMTDQTHNRNVNFDIAVITNSDEFCSAKDISRREMSSSGVKARFA